MQKCLVEWVILDVSERVRIAKMHVNSLGLAVSAEPLVQTRH